VGKWLYICANGYESLSNWQQIAKKKSVLWQMIADIGQIITDLA